MSGEHIPQAAGPVGRSALLPEAEDEILTARSDERRHHAK